jgi:hypothetical protein
MAELISRACTSEVLLFVDEYEGHLGSYLAGKLVHWDNQKLPKWSLT